MSASLEQLTNLLARTSSPFDPEVLIAVRKATALMVANDWTWPGLLANGAGHALTEEQLQRVYNAGLQRGEALGYQRGLADAQATTPQQAVTQVADDLTWISATLKAAEKAEQAGHLDEFETDFSGSMRARVARFGRMTHVSPKQHEALRRLEKSMKRRGYL